MGTHVIKIRCIRLFILLGIVAGVDGFLDFTCFSNKARIYINGDDDMFIGGYRSWSNTGVSIAFGRKSDTGTSKKSLTSPSSSSERHSLSIPGLLLVMPLTSGVERIGAFYCNAYKDGVNEKITTIIMSKASVVRPREISQTVSVGDHVTFVVDKDANVPSLRWRHNGSNPPFAYLHNRDTFTIQSVTTANAGVYECHQNHIRGQGIHAIFLLVVRACGSGKWNLQTCDRICPFCFNGGICDERSGTCVCAPGFSGKRCKTVHGRNKWGQDGKLQCSESDDHTYGCRGRLFCLPHPYGCSCAAGFKGLDCDQECDDGTYGANCKLQCNCAPGVSCLKDTGKCEGDQCNLDWHGVNCQVCEDTHGKCAYWAGIGECKENPDYMRVFCKLSCHVCNENELQPIGIIATSTHGNSIHLEWEHDVGDTDTCSTFVDYIVQYSLSDLDSCDLPQGAQMTSVSITNNKEYNISGLHYFSKYSVQVTARRRTTYRSTTAVIHNPIRTEQAGPAVAPTFATYEKTPYTLDVTWNEIPCGSRRGDGLQYKYRLKLPDENIHHDWQNTEGNSALLEDLTECTTYEFEVQALNDGGQGNSSTKSVSTSEIAPGPVNFPRVVTVISPEELFVTWNESNSNNCIEDTYIIMYKVLDADQCKAVEGDWERPTPASVKGLTTTLINLLPYTTYNVSITPSLSNVDGQVAEVTGITNASKPSIAPNITKVETTSVTFTVTWNDIPCGSRRGPGLEFEYRLKLPDGKLDKDWQRTKRTSAFINGLTECTIYEFEVRAANDVGHGDYSTASASTAPGAVNSANVFTVMSPTELNVTLSESKTENCHGATYLIKYKVVDADQCEALEGDWETAPSVTALSATLTQLIPYTTYNVSITPSLFDIDGEKTEVTGQTNISIPTGPPLNVTATTITSNTIRFEWLQPKCGERRGQTVAYSYILMDSGDAIVSSGMIVSTFVHIDDLKPFQNYTFTLNSSTDRGSGPSSEKLVVMTKEAVPSEPTNLTFVNVSKTSMTVTWQKPRYPNGVISKYSILYHVISKPYELSFNPNVQSASERFVNSADQVDNFKYEMKYITPSTKYEVRIVAYSNKGAGEIANATKFTLPATDEEISPPPSLSVEESIIKISSTTVAIIVTKSDSVYVTGYQVRVQLRRGVQKRQAASSTYIAAELLKAEKHDNPTFVVGDNNTYGSYHNPPLTEGATYRLYIGAVSRISSTTYGVALSKGLDVTVTPPEMSEDVLGKGTEPIVIPIIVIVVFLILLVFVIVCLIVKRQRPNHLSEGQRLRKKDNSVILFRTGGDKDADTIDIDTPGQEQETQCVTSADDTHSLPPVHPKPTGPTSLLNLNGPIKVAKFVFYVQEKKESHTNSFTADFATLPGDNLHPWKAAKKEENIKKNRYKNITTYDNSRVILQPLDGDPNSDFINASFIDGVYKESQYIASQGPNKASVEDFWRMIWQYNVRKIIMLTMLYETGKVKCHQYWPDEETVVAGVKITQTREDIFADFVIRTLMLHDETNNEIREVRQYHFTSWPDMSVPQCPTILSFVKVVNAYQPDEEGPPVVHCSAGVGRTGTYIAIDAMLEQAKQEGAVDVYDFVCKMRNKRMKMVQTSSQYQFIFDALLEAFISGDTVIESDAFVSQSTKLIKQGSKSGLTKQFKALEKLTVWPSESKCRAGLDQVNAARNRCPDIVPLDQFRPYLMTNLSEVGEPSGNYINATSVNGYRTKEQFIVTQTPLPDTVADIWRLLYDHSLNIIVMLNHINYKDPTMIKYWPDKGSSANFGPLKVRCVEEDKSVADVVVRTFQLSNSKNKGTDSRTIRQFALQTWSAEEDEARSPKSVITLIQCLKEHYDKDNSQRITVHCRDGVGASCVFCAIMMVLDQIEYSQTIDIFQTVRRLRLVRPQAVRNLAQYTFCYKIIQAHLRQQESVEEENGQIYANVNVNTESDGATLSIGDGQIYANIHG